METHFKPASPQVLSEIRDKKKRKENFITGEVIETIEKKEQLSNLHGHYTLEFFNEAGEMVEKVEADNAVPLVYSQLGTTRQLADVGIQHLASKDEWGGFNFPKFFNEGFIFYTQENNIQEEHIQGAIPSGQAIGLSTLDQAYSGNATFAGSINQSLCTVESGHNVTTMTYAIDFALERGNGTFDTVWLGHLSNQRYESSFTEMKFKVGGHMRYVDVLSPKFSELNPDLKFSSNTTHPVFYPLGGYTHFGQNYSTDSKSDVQGFFLYDSAPGTNEATLQKVEVLNNEFNTCEAGGATVYKGKPAIMKRQPVATNTYELVYFDLIKDTTFQLTNPQVIKLSTASIPNHNKLRLIHVKSFDNALYAFFKPVEEWSLDPKALFYCVKYSSDGKTYYGHTTFNYDSGATGVATDQYKLQSSLDVYRINGVDYMVLAYSHGMDHGNATVHYHVITSENKVLDKSKMNAFVETPRSNSAIWRQVEPNGLFFAQTCDFGSNSKLKLLALIPPFSHTKIPTTVKDSSQSMRLTYTIKIYHNVAEQYLPQKASLEEKILPIEDKEENNGVFSKIKSVFSSK